jgi:TonB-dependent receptor
MNTPRLASLLLLTTALATPTLAFAQNDATAPAATPPAGDTAGDPGNPPPAPDTAAPAEAPQEETDVSIPGGEIIVTGARERNIAKSSDQVISVLSTAEIAKTGEGNIAGALGRVTGLSLVGNGYVYVRGLGDRYSLALLNGSPLPSPEPLKRVVPLDLFPSGVIASSLVQKSYSVNFPGEFGGGVINLTTKAVPRDPFLSFGFGVSGDTETTGHLGYTYYGSKSDWTGFDNGQRDIPAALQAFFDSGVRLSAQTIDSRPIAASLVSGRSAAVQRWGHLPPNFSANLTGGKAFDLSGAQLGIIAAFGYSNKWNTRQALQQTAGAQDLSTVDSNFTQVNTDQRIVVNGLIGVGLEFGDNKIRWTNFYVRDTIKQARLSLGTVGQTPAGVTPADVMRQKTAWYERQLIDTQIVGEFKLTPDLSLDVRGGFANSKREAPFESSFEYVRTNSTADPYGAQFINVLNRQRGDARVTFSNLTEDLWSAGADLTYANFVPDVSVTVGGAWSLTKRQSSRREFFFSADLPAAYTGVGLLRPDLLLAPGIVNPGIANPPFRINLFEADEGNPAFDAKLRNWAGYAKLNTQMTEELSLDVGVRYEKATQTVVPIQVFNDPGASTTGTNLRRNYWLPGGTITYQVRPDLQIRVSASKTIARPQFRELINQPYFDPDTNRSYRGNPLLIDSQLYNGEARIEWYFAPEQRLSLSGFYKKIKNPIEAYVTGGDLITSFANAPDATLYGAEFEAQKNFDMSGVFGDKGFLATRKLAVVVNYTYTKSKIKVSASDLTAVPGVSNAKATDYFRDGAPLTGQSDHIANLQIGLEHPDHLSQQTFLLNYASNRVVSRGQFGTPPQPDVIEHPGFRLDFVAREGISLGKKRELEVKFEARNITGQKHEEYQKSGANRIDINTYDVGTTFALSASVKF